MAPPSHDQVVTDPPGTTCPNIQLKAPDSVAQGTQARVSTILAGGDRSVTYRWAVSSGKIISGQGTPSILVDTAGLAGASVTATLELGGVSKQCATTTASVSMLIGPSAQ